MRYKIPETFDFDRSGKYILSLRIRDNGCSFALHDPLVDGSFFYQEAAYNKKLTPVANFKEFFFDNPLLALPYRKLQVMSCTPRFTCIPSIIYEEKEKEKIFEFNFSEKGSKTLAQPLPQSQLHIIYDMDNGLYEFLHRSLDNPQFIHHSSPLIAYFQGRSRMGNIRKLIVNPQGDSIDVLCFSQSELLLVNNFSCKDTEDMVYYTLYIWKHLGLDQLKDHLLITEDKSSRETLMERLQPYIRNLLPFDITPEHHLSGVDTKNIPFDQLSLSLCEL